MSRRTELGDLVRNLRQYLQWQAVPLAASLPAADEERQQWQAAERERQKAALARTLAPTPEPTPEPRPGALAQPPESKPAAALWKDESLGSGPRKTFERVAPGKRTETLEEIRADLGDCQRCGLCEERKNIVFGVGNPNARLMFVGEAPGFNEDLEGEPFVGKAGELLDKMITAMTLSRDEVYIANVIKCRPPQNRDPAPDEIQQCSPFLERQVKAIQPEVIVALGKFAANLLSGNTGSLSRVRGTWQQYNGVPLMPTYHPAYLLRTPADKGRAWDDLKKVMERLDLEIPNKYR